MTVAAVAAAYINALPAAFVFDDHGYINRDDGAATIWPPTWLRGTRPLLGLSLAVSHALAAKDDHGDSGPRGYHAFNIVVHIAASLVLFALLRRTLRLPAVGPWPDQQADGLALATTLVWAVHPLNTQAVTYVVQRCESMAALGIVAYIYCLLRCAQGATPAARWRWGAASLAACLFGLASKETGTAAIPIGVIFDRALLASSWRELFTRRGWIHGALFVLAAIGIAKIAPGVLRDGIKTTGYNIGTFTWWEYARSQPAVILHYLKLSLWPDRLCVDFFGLLAAIIKRYSRAQ